MGAKTPFSFKKGVGILKLVTVGYSPETIGHNTRLSGVQLGLITVLLTLSCVSKPV